jgi:hypothetical protein
MLTFSWKIVQGVRWLEKPCDPLAIFNSFPAAVFEVDPQIKNTDKDQ